MDSRGWGALLVLVLVAGRAVAATSQAADCRVGAYRFDDGRVLDIGATSRGLRWRTPEGVTGALVQDGTGGMASMRGWTGRTDGHRLEFAPCAEGQLRFDGVPARRIGFDVREATIAREGIALAGRLVMPPGSAAVPVVVMVHGSESTSALDTAAWQRLLPAAGIGAFVYDKRGTGRSGGRYTQDFHVLAADAAAAAREARRLAGPRLAALVYEGASQGGWVLPLAQAIEPADRLIVGYGLTVSPLEENRSEALAQLRARGVGEADLAQAEELIDATGELMASGFRDGFGRYAALRRRHRGAPWFARIEGEFSGAILRYPPWLLRLAAPVARRRSDRGTPWRHDPLPALRAVDVPLLWVIAGDDTEAPPERTREDLARLQSEGERITVLEFPGTEHGVVEFETPPDGRRVTTRVADGYFRAVADFARNGRLGPARYGQALRRDPLQP